VNHHVAAPFKPQSTLSFPSLPYFVLVHFHRSNAWTDFDGSNDATTTTRKGDAKLQMQTAAKYVHKTPHYGIYSPITAL